MKYCRNCGLPETLPTAKLDEQNICQYCRRFRPEQDQEAIRARLRARFEELLDAHRGKGSFDVLMAYSGGKDSSYTLHLLRDAYKARVLAYTLDHGFVPAQTKENIRNICESLDVAHLQFYPEPGVLRKVFNTAHRVELFSSKSLERASNVCTVCMAFVKFFGFRLAIERNIPFIAYGWSPGQAPLQSSVRRMAPQMLEQSHRGLFDPLCQHVESEILRPYFLESDLWSDPDRIPYQINPLAFHKVTEDEIVETIEGFGWVKPEGLDSNTTNCQLNSYAIYEHQERFGFHPYAFELATLVREGLMTRAEAIARLEKPVSPELVKRAKEWLDGD